MILFLCTENEQMVECDDSALCTEGELMGSVMILLVCTEGEQIVEYYYTACVSNV